MKIALLGYGKMGREIEKMALEQKHEIVLIIDIHNTNELTTDNLKQADVAIDFSIPQSAYANIMTCFNANIPVISGTTGWMDKFQELLDYCLKNNKTFFYASNYSIGVNVMFSINKQLAQFMNKFPEYKISIEETHHIHKLDAPSGTAITLAEGIINEVERVNEWKLSSGEIPCTIAINSIRENEITGIHCVKYDSSNDSIEIKHTAKNRKGLALGALLAAEFIKDKTGYYTMNDLMNAEQ